MEAIDRVESGTHKPRRLPRLLVVDESRIVRAMMIRHLREFYEVREEADGEAAWQVIVLDHSIELVVCALSLPVLDGDGLLQRVRGSRLRRLAQMPMLMVYGDNDANRERAHAHGASDFVDRQAGAADLLARIDLLRKLAQAQQQLVDDLEQHVTNPESGLFTRRYIELQAVQAFSLAQRHRGEISVLVIAFDDIGVIHDEHGGDAVKQLQQRLAEILATKVRKEDSLGHFAGSQLVVVSPGTPFRACEAFANRLRAAIEGGSVTVRGQRLNLSVSIGVANSPVDNVDSAGALIELAGVRLRAGQQDGGNRVRGGDGGAVPQQTLSLGQALSLIDAGRENEVAAHLPALVGQLLPIFRLLAGKLPLPLVDIEKYLRDQQAGGDL